MWSWVYDCGEIWTWNIVSWFIVLVHRCVECHGLFSPIRFVAHSHKRQENRTCHWGFDSANWRHYLLLSRDQEDRERWEKALDDFKGKFEHKRKVRGNDEFIAYSLYVFAAFFLLFYYILFTIQNRMTGCKRIFSLVMPFNLLTWLVISLAVPPLL